MSAKKKKRFCAHPGCGVPLQTKREYCTAHTCQAFSVAYEDCVMQWGHRNKHMNKAGEEWE